MNTKYVDIFSKIESSDMEWNSLNSKTKQQPLQIRFWKTCDRRKISKAHIQILIIICDCFGIRSLFQKAHKTYINEETNMGFELAQQLLLQDVLQCVGHLVPHLCDLFGAHRDHISQKHVMTSCITC